MDLTVRKDNSEDLLNLPTEHLRLLHQSREQDAVLFAEGEHVEALVSKLTPAVFRSPCPVFLPENYTSLIDLRLDSNVILYEDTGKQFASIDLLGFKSRFNTQTRTGQLKKSHMINSIGSNRHSRHISWILSLR